MNGHSANTGPAERSLTYSAYLLSLSAPVSIVLAQAAAGLVILSGLACLMTGSKAATMPVWVRAIMPAFLATVILSSILSPDFSSAVSSLKKIWVLLCLIPLVAFSHVYSKRNLAGLLILGTSIASILGLYRYVTGAVERAAPFSGGYTTLALFEAAVLPLAIGLFAADRSIKRWLYAIAVPIMAAGLLFSGTRAGWISAVAGIIIIGFFLNRKITLIALFGACLCIAAIPRSRNLVIDRFRSDRQGGITSGRTILYRTALDAISDLPFWGYGPGSFKRIVPDEVLDRIGDKGIKSWHSTPLEILIESGPMAALLLLAFFVFPLTRFRRYWEKADSADLIGIASLCALVALYLAGLTTDLMRDFMVLSLLAVIWSMSISRRPDSAVAGNKSGISLLSF